MPRIDRRWLVVVTAVLALIGTADSLLSLIDRLQSGVDLGAMVAAVFAAARLVAGPVALVLVILMWRGRSQRDASRVIRPEWESMNQGQHFASVRGLALDAQEELRSAIGKAEVTVRDQNNLRALADSVDLQVGVYSDMWQRGRYWMDRSQWESAGDHRFDGPLWAQPLWDRIWYAVYWLNGHDQLRTTWEDDPGSG